MNRHQRQWQAAAREHGFLIQPRRRSGHLRFHNPTNGAVVTCSSTPSDVYAMKKFVADLRRANRRRNLTEPAVCGDPPPTTPDTRHQPLQAAPEGRPATVSTGEPAMPTVTELTIGSLRRYADTQAEQRSTPNAGTLRRAVINVLDASSYLDTDRLIDFDFTELDAMLATTRPDLNPTSRSTYLGQVRRVAQALIDQTAAQHGHTPPVLTRRTHPSPARSTTNKATNSGQQPDATPTNTGEHPTAQPAVPAVLTFPFPLRPGLTVTLTLPADLTVPEAERLTQMIKLLPVGSS